MPNSPLPRPLILGSTSPYRRELLQRLRLPFEVVRPEVDETPHAGELPVALAQRLAMEKALAVARQQAYLQAEQPYDCAGSAKSEGLGIALLEQIDNQDPSALVGLPLIHTCRLLRAAGLPLLN